MKSVIAGSSFTGWVFAMQATAARDGGAAARGDVLLVFLPGLSQMGVHVEEAGCDPPALGLDDLGAPGIEARTQRCDHALLDEDIAGLVPVRRRVDDPTVAHEDSAHAWPPLGCSGRRPAKR
jgi:hypothetical protein